MRALFFKKQFLLFVLAAGAALWASPSQTHASQCVVDYLTSTLPKLQAKFNEVRDSLVVGSVPSDRYNHRKNLKIWGQGLRSYEAGRITESHLPENHWLLEWVKKIHAQGGELRLLEHEVWSRINLSWERIDEYGGYFIYDLDTHAPYIAVSGGVTPYVLAHEFDHFEKWLNLRNSLMNQGFEVDAAGKAAYSSLFEDTNGIRFTERTAVGKELQKESEIQRSVYSGNPVKWRYPSGALPFTELEDLTRHLTYPEAEAVQFALTQKSKDAVPLMRALIKKALLLRLTAYQRAQNALAKAPKGMKLDLDEHAQYMQGLEKLDDFFDSVMLWVKGRFQVAQVYDQARELFEAELPSVWESLPVQKRGNFKPHFKAGQ